MNGSPLISKINLYKEDYSDKDAKDSDFIDETKEPRYQGIIDKVNCIPISINNIKDNFFLKTCV